MLGCDAAFGRGSNADEWLTATDSVPRVDVPSDSPRGLFGSVLTGSDWAGSGWTTSTSIGTASTGSGWSGGAPRVGGFDVLRPLGADDAVVAPRKPKAAVGPVRLIAACEGILVGGPECRDEGGVGLPVGGDAADGAAEVAWDGEPGEWFLVEIDAADARDPPVWGSVECAFSAAPVNFLAGAGGSGRRERRGSEGCAAAELSG